MPKDLFPPEHYAVTSIDEAPLDEVDPTKDGDDGAGAEARGELDEKP